MNTRLLELYQQRDEIEAFLMDPRFAACEMERAEFVLEGLEEEMRHLITDGMLHLRNQA
ncbi:MAG TPA: hypothetical protein VN577_18185 [Terriglobales bacterium]|nr:hypothetical protein [Terriglobales bacterium]